MSWSKRRLRLVHRINELSTKLERLSCDLDAALWLPCKQTYHHKMTNEESLFIDGWNECLKWIDQHRNRIRETKSSEVREVSERP